MINPKRMYFMVITLCLWLPLQAVAGQWLHCAKIESSLAVQSNLTVQSTLVIASNLDTAPEPSCHGGAPVTESGVSAIEPKGSQAPLSSDSSAPCGHCQLLCHWSWVAPLPELVAMATTGPLAYSRLTVPTPLQPALATPQRPPQFIL